MDTTKASCWIRMGIGSRLRRRGRSLRPADAESSTCPHPRAFARGLPRCAGEVLGLKDSRKARKEKTLAQSPQSSQGSEPKRKRCCRAKARPTGRRAASEVTQRDGRQNLFSGGSETGTFLRHAQLSGATRVSYSYASPVYGGGRARRRAGGGTSAYPSLTKDRLQIASWPAGQLADNQAMTTALPNPLVVMALELESQGVFVQAGIPVLHTGVGKI